MLGSMYSAVSGLSAHQTKMNVIGNNIANVNTYGFKSSRVTFTDVFYQTLRAAASPTATGGGTNPTQLGYGARVGSIDVINTRAGSATTDRPLDVYINGEGYLPVKDSYGIIRYTRVGVLSFDVEGNLVDNAGNMVLGIPLDADTGKAKLGADGTVSAQELMPIKVSPEDLDRYTGISIGSNGEITAIREGDPIVVPAANTPWLERADISEGSLYQGAINMTVIRSDDLAFLPADYPGGGGTIDAGHVTLGDTANVNGAMKVSYDGTDYILTYKEIGGGTEKKITGTPDGGTPEKVTFVLDGSDPDAFVSVMVDADPLDGIVLPADGTNLTIGTAVAAEITIKVATFDKAGDPVELAATWQAGAVDNTKVLLGDMTFNINPLRFGALASYELQDTMVGTAGPGAGEPVKIANLAVVKFSNPDGLSQTGEGYYVETGNSGKPVGTLPGNNGTGTLRAGSLEMSNVDLSREFTEMIIAQRGFQANTRMITVSDEMLNELVNMKR